MVEPPTLPPAGTLIGFPNAKVNIGLQVRKKRKDGFHEIESLFVPIPWKDTLELEVRPLHESTSLLTHGLSIPGRAEENLILRAHSLLQEEYGLPPVRFHLVKSIPMGAGLGGGSADGAFALRLLNQKFELNLGTEQLKAHAATLGSDCPFFIQNTPSLVSGRGDKIQPIALPLEGWWWVLIHPGVHIDTQAAFGWVEPNDKRPRLDSSAGKEPAEWNQALLTNDFAGPVTERYPAVRKALDRIRKHGAVFSDMSGSGSTVFGLFAEEPATSLLKDCPKNWKTWQGKSAL